MAWGVGIQRVLGKAGLLDHLSSRTRGGAAQRLRAWPSGAHPCVPAAGPQAQVGAKRGCRAAVSRVAGEPAGVATTPHPLMGPELPARPGFQVWAPDGGKGGHGRRAASSHAWAHRSRSPRGVPRHCSSPGPARSLHAYICRDPALPCLCRKSKAKPNGKKPVAEEKKVYLEPEYTKSRITDFGFKELVVLPREIDLNEWLASNSTWGRAGRARRAAPRFPQDPPELVLSTPPNHLRQLEAEARGDQPCRALRVPSDAGTQCGSWSHRGTGHQGQGGTVGQEHGCKAGSAVVAGRPWPTGRVADSPPPAGQAQGSCDAPCRARRQLSSRER